MKFFLWFLYWPCLKFLSLFVFWVPAYQARKKFEMRNTLDPLCESFREKGSVADLCFEFSSEGEFQQVASLVDDALIAGKRIELVFFSPSVEKAIMALALSHPAQVRYLRYPLLRFSPWGKGRCFGNWITSGKFILVRYDFFPEFLVWSRQKGHELILLWMTFKKERSQEKNVSWAKLLFIRSASKVFYASLPDQAMGTNLNLPGRCYDFRMEQIKRRVAVREDKFQKMFAQYPGLKASWEQYPPHKRLIIGNAWPSDFFLFEHLPEDYFVLVVPHQLTPEIIRSISNSLTKSGRSPVEIRDGSAVPEGQTFILNKKGVLCELYAYFGLAYVGGGFETSVHSLLEPLVAGCDAIACGKLHHRSTEFDVAFSLGKMTELQSSKDLLAWLARPHDFKKNENGLSDVFAKYEHFRKDVISC